MYILEKPNIEKQRIVFTPGTPKSDVVSGYVIWSSTSCGLLPGQSVNTICWFSPMSGIASTATGFLGQNRSSQSNGATYIPQPTKNMISSHTTSLFSKQKRIILSTNDGCCPFNSSIELCTPRNNYVVYLPFDRFAAIF